MVHISIDRYRRPDPRPTYEDGRRVRFHYYGQWYTGHVDRVTGREAIVVWRLLGAWAAINHDGNVWRKRRVKPERHGAHWRSSEIRRQLKSRGVEFDTVGTFVTALRNGERMISLIADDFETQALANALDRLAGRWVVDRGACDIPRVPLW